jgi:hypothetical protein
MAKDLPYFKFIISEWNDGDITLCTFEAQGLFINLCSLYWSCEGILSIQKAKRKFSHCPITAFDELVAEGIIKIHEDMIRINFLDEQFADRQKLCNQNKKNIKKRWKKDRNTDVIRAYNERIVDRTDPVYNKEERRKEKKREQEKKPPSPKVLIETYATKEEAFNSMRDNEIYMEECKMVLSGRGWNAEEVDILGLVRNFLAGKVELEGNSQDNVRQHFKNWIFREKVENLTTLAHVFRNELKRQSA